MLKPLELGNFKNLGISAPLAQQAVGFPFFKGKINIKAPLKKDIFQKAESAQISFEGNKNQPQIITNKEELLDSIPENKKSKAEEVLNTANKLSSRGIAEIKCISYEPITTEQVEIVDGKETMVPATKDSFSLSIVADGYNDIKFDKQINLDNVVFSFRSKNFQLNSVSPEQLKDFSNILLDSLSKEGGTSIPKDTKADELKNAIIERYRIFANDKNTKTSGQYSKIIDSVYSQIKSLETLCQEGAKISNVGEDDIKNLKSILSGCCKASDIGDISKFYVIDTKFGKKFYTENGALAAINKDDTYNLYLGQRKNFVLKNGKRIDTNQKWSKPTAKPAAISHKAIKERNVKTYKLIEDEINSNKEFKDAIIKQSKTNPSSEDMGKLILSNKNIQEGLKKLSVQSAVIDITVGDKGTILFSLNGKQSQDFNQYKHFIAETQNKFSGACAETGLFAQLLQKEHEDENFKVLYDIQILEDKNGKYYAKPIPPCETCKQGMLLYGMQYED